MLRLQRRPLRSNQILKWHHSLCVISCLPQIQMIGDRDRGWGWTRALLGLPAKEIHVCGDPAALPLLQVRLNHSDTCCHGRKFAVR